MYFAMFVVMVAIMCFIPLMIFGIFHGIQTILLERARKKAIDARNGNWERQDKKKQIQVLPMKKKTWRK